MYESFGMRYQGEEGLSYNLEIRGHPITFEMDDNQNDVLITTFLGRLPTGSFRAEVLREALRHNGFPPPAFGKFAFSKDMDGLVYFHKIPIHRLSKDRLVEETPPFIQTALSWRDSLATATVPTAMQVEAGRLPSFLDVLGIKPEILGL